MPDCSCDYELVEDGAVQRKRWFHAPDCPEAASSTRGDMTFSTSSEGGGNREHLSSAKAAAASGPELSAASPTPRYRTIVADPPWEYGGFVSLWPSGDKKASRPLPYSSMSLYEIAGLPLSDWAEADCNLFVWTTNRYLPFTFPLIEHWGFEYRQTITWAKTNPAPWSGSIAPHSTEFLLVASRGRSGYVERLESSVISHRRLGHSEKPEVFLDLIESASPGPYLEMFSRRARLGWDTWGDEALHGTERVA